MKDDGSIDELAAAVRRINQCLGLFIPVIPLISAGVALYCHFKASALRDRAGSEEPYCSGNEFGARGKVIL